MNHLGNRGFLMLKAIAAILSVGGVASVGTSAQAVTFQPYNRSHTFTFNFGTNVPTRQRASVSGQVQARENKALCPDVLPDYQKNPPAIATRQKLPLRGNANARCPSGRTFAFANSEVNAIWSANTLRVTTRAWGQASASTNNVSLATATSTAQYSINQILATASSLRLGLDSVSLDSGGDTNSTWVTSYEVEDPITNKILMAGDLLKIQSSTDGIVDWTNQSLDFSGVTDGIFKISLGDDLIGYQGKLQAVFKDGCLVNSQDSGTFDGWLSALGSCNGSERQSSVVTAVQPLDLMLNIPSFGTAVNFRVVSRATGSAKAQNTLTVPEPLTVMGTFTAFGLGSWLRRKFLAKSR